MGATPFGARYYHARLGRWLSPDPLAVHALGADLNVYAYVGGQTFAAVDPWGLQAVQTTTELIITAPPPEPPPPPPYPASAPLSPDAGVPPPVFGGIDPGVARQLFNLLSGPPAQNLANAADAARKKNATLKGFGRGVLRSRLASVQEDITIPIAPMLPPGASPASIIPPNAGDPGEEAGEQFEKAVSFVARIALGGVAAGAGGAQAAGEVAGTDASGEGGQLWRIQDGVRRAKAAHLSGIEELPAEFLDASGRSVSTGTVRVDSLLSPKAVIDTVSMPGALTRWLNTLRLTASGSTPPAIRVLPVAPGAAGTPVPLIRIGAP